MFGRGLNIIKEAVQSGGYAAGSAHELISFTTSPSSMFPALHWFIPATTSDSVTSSHGGSLLGMKHAGCVVVVVLVEVDVAVEVEVKVDVVEEKIVVEEVVDVVEEVDETFVG